MKVTKKTIRRFGAWVKEVGGHTEAARQISAYEKTHGRPGLSDQAVRDWINQSRIPVRRFNAVAALTDITRAEMSPDLFGPEVA